MNSSRRRKWIREKDDISICLTIDKRHFGWWSKHSVNRGLIDEAIRNKFNSENYSERCNDSWFNNKLCWSFIFICYRISLMFEILSLFIFNRRFFSTTTIQIEKERKLRYKRRKEYLWQRVINKRKQTRIIDFLFREIYKYKPRMIFTC